MMMTSGNTGVATPFRWAELGRILKERGLTRTELAHRLSISRGTLANWEHGRIVLSQDRINRVAKVLEIPPAEISPGRDSDPRLLVALPSRKWRSSCALLPYLTSDGELGRNIRRDSLDCSELVGALGLATDTSPMSIWLDKVRPVAPSSEPASQEAQWVRRVAPYLRDDVEKALGRKIRTIGPVVSTKHPWLRYSPDGVFEDDPGTLFVAESTSIYWKERWSGTSIADVPIQGGMIVTGATRAVVGGVTEQGTTAWRLVEADSVVQAAIIDGGRALWKCVSEVVPPSVDGLKATTDALEELLSPDLVAAHVVLDEDGAAADLADQYRALEVEIDALNRRRDEIENQLRIIIGPNKTVINAQGRKIAALTEGGVRADQLTREFPDVAAEVTVAIDTVDTQKLKALHPDVYAAVVTTVLDMPPRRTS